MQVLVCKSTFFTGSTGIKNSWWRSRTCPFRWFRLPCALEGLRYSCKNRPFVVIKQKQSIYLTYSTHLSLCQESTQRDTRRECRYSIQTLCCSGARASSANTSQPPPTALTRAPHPSCLSRALMHPLTATHTDRHRKTHWWSEVKWEMMRGWDEENNSLEFGHSLRETEWTSMNR